MAENRSTGGLSVDALRQLLQDANGQSPQAILPLEQWEPAFCGSMNLVIRANGDWEHDGRPFTREALVRLFSTVLWRERDESSDRYFLKTPAEKIEIEVEDVPLLVTAVEQVSDSGQIYLRLTTRTGDRVIADAEHPIVMRLFGADWRPYVRVRRNLDALIHRNSFYHLLTWATERPSGEWTIRSGPHEFLLGCATGGAA